MPAKALLGASRTDVFRISVDMPPDALDRLDLRLVQSVKRTSDSIEVKFADLAKLCELALRADELSRAAENPSAPSDIELLHGLLLRSAEALARKNSPVHGGE